MNAQRGIQFRIVPHQHGGHAAARRHPRHVDARRVDVMVSHHLAGHGSDHCSVAVLVRAIVERIPVPAAQEIGRERLLGIQHDHTRGFRSFVHTSAGRELGGTLLASVQEHEQRRWSVAATGRLIKHVPSRVVLARLSVNESAFDETSGLRSSGPIRMAQGHGQRGMFLAP